MINVEGLTLELAAAGIVINGCNSNGVVWDTQGNEIQSRPDVAAVIAAHDPQIWELRRQRIQARLTQAKSEAALAIQLRTLTPQQAVNYIDTNVTSLATAKDVLKIMARILIAMRDQIWPDLPE